MALPMIRENGVGSLIVENPFYGLRKPPRQLRSSLHNVTDLLVMGACLVMESSVLYNWAETQCDAWPLVSHGISMGGHMAALSASVWRNPIGLVPCMACSSASWTFIHGVMTRALPWDLLEEQYHREIQCNQDILSLIYPDKEEYKILQTFDEPQYAKLSQLVKSSTSQRKQEVIEFMRRILDECTHFKNYPVPLDPSLIIIVSAEIDAYQPVPGVTCLSNIWPGAQIRFIKDKGHVQSYLFNQRDFRQAIYDVIDKIRIKYERNH